MANMSQDNHNSLQKNGFIEENLLWKPTLEETSELSFWSACNSKKEVSISNYYSLYASIPQLILIGK